MTVSATKKTFPSEEEVLIARESGRALSSFLSANSKNQKIMFRDNKEQTSFINIPESALRLLMEILTEIGQGNAVSVVPIHSEMTTQEAADLLNVSRPFLIQLLEKGKIPFHKIGTHRRVNYQDVIAYKKHTDSERYKALEELTNQGQELDMGY